MRQRNVIITGIIANMGNAYLHMCDPVRATATFAALFSQKDGHLCKAFHAPTECLSLQGILSAIVGVQVAQ